MTVKKFASNATKKCIVAEYIVSGAGAKKEEAPKDTPKKKGGVPAAAASVKTLPPTTHDNVPAVTQQMVRDLLAVLKAEGVSLSGGEEKIEAKFASVVEVPLVALKNTAYTNGS